MKRYNIETPLSSRDATFLWSDRTQIYAQHSPTNFLSECALSVIQHALSGNPKYQSLLPRGLEKPFHLQTWLQLFPRKPSSLRFLSASPEILSCVAKNVVLSMSTFDAKNFDMNATSDRSLLPFLHWFQQLPLENSYLQSNLPSAGCLSKFPELILLYGPIISTLDAGYQARYRNALCEKVVDFIAQIDYFSDKVDHRQLDDFENQYFLIPLYESIFEIHHDEIIPSMYQTFMTVVDCTPFFRVFSQYILPKLDALGSDRVAVQTQLLLNSLDLTGFDATINQFVDSWRSRQPADRYSAIEKVITLYQGLEGSEISFSSMCERIYESYMLSFNKSTSNALEI